MIDTHHTDTHGQGTRAPTLGKKLYERAQTQGYWSLVKFLSDTESFSYDIARFAVRGQSMQFEADELDVETSG